MRFVGETLGVPIHVFGPETHMTAIVGMALGKRKVTDAGPQRQNTTANFLLPGGQVCKPHYVQASNHYAHHVQRESHSHFQNTF